MQFILLTQGPIPEILAFFHLRVGLFASLYLYTLFLLYRQFKQENAYLLNFDLFDDFDSFNS